MYNHGATTASRDCREEDGYTTKNDVQVGVQTNEESKKSFRVDCTLDNPRVARIEYVISLAFEDTAGVSQSGLILE
jgi:hypothetical protein